MKIKMIPRRIAAALVCVAMLIAVLPFISTSAADPLYNKVTDPATLSGWKKYFSPDTLTTRYAGGVWTDKSVFSTIDEFKAASGYNANSLTIGKNNFLVSLSALAANKTIVGYSNLPSDTVLVLDVSGSLVNKDGDGDARSSQPNLEEMVNSTNDAIKRLYELNLYNRVGIVLYSGNSDFGDSRTSTGTVLLPIDRYECTDGNYVKLVFGERREGNDRIDIVSVSVGDNVKRAGGSSVTGSKEAVGGTYIQNGLYKAWQEFEKLEEKTIPVGQPQAGTKRIPIVVLMSDGAPTSATDDYSNVGTSNVGDGGSTTNQIAFLTQLTASYLRGKLEQAYGRAPLFYTLALGFSSLSENAEPLATSVLDPKKSTSDINTYWNTYKALTNDQVMTLRISRNNNRYLSKDAAVTTQYYVDDTFSADDANGLKGAFDRIVSEIVIQSQYYPTLVDDGKHDFDGYITFHDVIGDYMEVKAVKGMLLGDERFSGATMASYFRVGGGLGTESKPTEMGKEFIDAVMARIGLTDRNDAIDLVYEAYSYRQLYTEGSTFSNYIGWYGDENNEFVGFWHEGQSADEIANAKGKGAKYVNRSYGFLGAVTSGMTESDMMHIIIQVHTDIDTRHQELVWMIPASLIPTVTYKVSIEGTEILPDKDAHVEYDASEPLQLLFEVGLRSDLNEFNIVSKLGDAHKDSNGNYVFYTNAWNNAHKSTITTTSHENTLAWFEPSVENERYYYAESAVVYKKVGNDYLRVTDENEDFDNGEYYHGLVIYEESSNVTAAGANARSRILYEQITEISLGLAEYDRESGVYVIPQGTVYHQPDTIELSKTDNNTETRKTSVEVIITTPAARQAYMSMTVHGDNGRLTLTPAQGIKLTKTAEAVAAGAPDEFVFTIELTAPAGQTLDSEYPYTVFAYDGTVTSGATSVENGKVTLRVKVGDEVYLTGLPTGTTYVITENAHEEYVLSEINGQSASSVRGEVKDRVIESYAFHNVIKNFGGLVVSKQVTHNAGDGYIPDPDITFNVKVEFTDVPVGTDLTGVTVSDPNAVIAAADGYVTFTVKANQHVIIDGIPDGVKYKVTEQLDADSGFTLSNGSSGLEGNISTSGHATAILVNHYDPLDVSGSLIKVVGEKVLKGREWLDSDVFEFELRYFNGTEMETVATVSTTKASKAFDFNSAMAGITYDKVGLYQYAVVEKAGSIGGVKYDVTERRFDVLVTDEDTDGKLEIKSVTGSTNTLINYDTVYTVGTEFTNVYAASDSATVEIVIDKTVVTNTEKVFALSGFKFGLYDAAGVLVKEAVTDENGKAIISIVYASDDVTIDNVFTYTVREIEPDEPDRIAGMTYTDKTYTLKVKVVDNLDGTISAYLLDETGGLTDKTGTELEFVNTHYEAPKTSDPSSFATAFVVGGAALITVAYLTNKKRKSKEEEE